jgi:hypothetical protein
MPGFHNIQAISKSPKIISLQSICDIIKGNIIIDGLLRGYVIGVEREDDRMEL